MKNGVTTQYVSGYSLKETKEELEKSLNKLSNEDNFIICSLYGIKTKKITQKKISKDI